MATLKEQIKERVLELLGNHPDGIRHGELVQKVAESNASFKRNNVLGTVRELRIQSSDKVYRPAPGVYRLTKFLDQATDQLKPELIPKPPLKVKEAAFYKPFADWLVDGLEDCTKAIPLGGGKFKDKWGTPDVIGKRESKPSDILQAPTEIVSAEIKLDTQQLVTAFGQACAYRLFSHKSYLVVPKDSPQDEVARLDALCQVFGIGLILFDASSPEDPGFDILVRPRKQDPEMFYTNKYLKLIEKEMFS